MEADIISAQEFALMLNQINHEVLNNKLHPITIIEYVATYYGVSIDMLLSRNREVTVSKPRQIAMYLCKILTECSLNEIGYLLGRRNRSSIAHGIEKISVLYESDECLRDEITDIKKAFEKYL